MLDIGVKISGLKEMEKALVKMSKEIGAKKSAGIMTGAIRDGAKEFEEEIKLRAPESTTKTKIRSLSKRDRPYNKPGFLKSRIKTRASTNRRGSVSKKYDKNTVTLVRTGYFNVFYAGWLEYGNSQQRANPVLRRAFASKKGTAVIAIGHGMAKRIELARKRIAREQKQT